MNWPGRIRWAPLMIVAALVVTACAAPTATPVPPLEDAPASTESPTAMDTPAAMETPAVTDTPAAVESPATTETPPTMATQAATDTPEGVETAEPATTPAAGPVVIELAATGYAFSVGTITVPTGAQVVIEFTNNDADGHNFAVYRTANGRQAIFSGEIIRGPDAHTTYEFTAPQEPGTYRFQCDPHASLMFGDFVVEGAAQTSSGSTQGSVPPVPDDYEY